MISMEKPLNSINKIFEFCIKDAKARIASPKDTLILSDIVFISSGDADLTRHDGMVLLNLSAPMVVGLSNIVGVDSDFSIKFNSKGSFSTIKKREFIERLNKHELWYDVSSILSYTIHLLYKRDDYSVNKTKYSIVKKYIEHIWSLPENERDKISLYEYIMSRANISRSSLNKIILALNQGNYIKTYRGKIINVGRIPNSY